MNIKQKRMCNRLALFIIVFTVSNILLYNIFVHFIPTHYPQITIYKNATRMTTFYDSVTCFYNNFYILVSGIVGCTLGIVSTRIIE